MATNGMAANGSSAYHGNCVVSTAKLAIIPLINESGKVKLRPQGRRLLLII